MSIFVNDQAKALAFLPCLRRSEIFQDPKAPSGSVAPLATVAERT